MSPAAWGDPIDHPIVPEESESLPAEIDLGGGFKLRLAPDAFRKIMHSPQITAAVQQRGEAIGNYANATVITEGAQYEFVMSTNPDTTRTRTIRPSLHLRRALSSTA